MSVHPAPSETSPGRSGEATARRGGWRKIGLAVAAAGLVVAAAWAGYVGLRTWRLWAELGRAREEVAKGWFPLASRRLEVLRASHPGELGGEVEYWLGVSEASQGHFDQARAAFARVPANFPFEPLGARLEARANLRAGRLRAAERRLVQVIGRGGSGLNPARAVLAQVYEEQGRYDDIVAVLRDTLPEAPDPVDILRRVWKHDRTAFPGEELREALDDAERLAPDDDRVWLGRARLATAIGRLDDAAAWLRRCEASPAGADDPVWLAWLDWARAADRPAEAIRALRHLSPGRLRPAERLAWRAWLLQRKGDREGERKALEAILDLEPNDRRALDRLAEIAARDGHADRAAEFRRRLVKVDEAADAYRHAINGRSRFADAPSRLAMGRLAEAAGRRFDARAWYDLALKLDPTSSEASAALARLDTPRPGPDAPPSEPWAGLDPPASPARPTSAEPELHGLQFTDDAEAAGLRFVYDNARSPIHQLPETIGGGVALIDYDGDGRLDVFLVQGGPFPPAATAPSASGGDRLFRNRGDGTFEDVTARAGLDGPRRGFGMGVAVGDIDNDGRPDLLVTRWRSYALYRNKGDGTFEDVTAPAGLDGDRDWPTSAAFADLDDDGDLDLYVCHYCAWDPADPTLCRESPGGPYISCSPTAQASRPDHLFRNDGGRFVDVTREAGIVDRDGRGLGVVAADLDGDGKTDLFVANDMTANFLWRNLGGMRFEEVGHLAGVAGAGDGGYRAGMGVACGDVDGDGRPDLAVTNYFGEATRLYRNLGEGLFADQTDPSGLGAASRPLLGFGIAFFDADDDGRLDLATANGHVNDLRPHFRFEMPAQLFQGLGGGRLRDVSDRAGVPWSVPRMGRGLAAGDLDNDGRVDVLIVSQKLPLAYLHNRTAAPGHALTLRLEGRRSNRDGVGARVRVTAGGHTLIAERVGGGSFLSASDPRLHVGLADATRAESVEVAWPSGQTDRFRDLAADAGYLLREGDPNPLPIAGFPSPARPVPVSAR